MQPERLMLLLAAPDEFHIQVVNQIEGFESCRRTESSQARADVWMKCGTWEYGFVVIECDAFSRHRLVGQGLYDYQMALWSTSYHKRDFCIIWTDFLKDDKKASLDTVGAFLGLDPFEWEKSDFKPFESTMVLFRSMSLYHCCRRLSSGTTR
jgi:hypothetical protein